MANETTATQTTNKKPTPMRFYRISNQRAGKISFVVTACLTAAYLILFSNIVSLSALGILDFGLAILTTSLAGAWLGFLGNGLIFGFRDIYIQQYINEGQLTKNEIKCLDQVESKINKKQYWDEAIDGIIYALIGSALIMLDGALHYSTFIETLPESTVLFAGLSMCACFLFAAYKVATYSARYIFMDKIEPSEQQMRSAFAFGYLCTPNMRAAMGGVLPIEHFSLTIRQNLKSSTLRQLYLNKNLSFKQLRDLRPRQLHALKIDQIRKRFVNNELCLATVTNPHMQLYINDEQINEENALNLMSYQIDNLNSPNIRQLFDDRHLNFQQALNLIPKERVPLENAHIRERFVNRELCLATVAYPHMQLYINDGQINEENALRLVHYKRDNLNSSNIRQLFDERHLNFQQACNLDRKQRVALENAQLRTRFVNHELCLATVAYPHMQLYINDGLITEENALRLVHYKRDNLNSPSIRQLIEGNHLNFQQALNLSQEQRVAFEADDIRNRILRGELNILQVLDGQRERNTPTLNDSQSTHTESVHKTVSNSALKLSRRYHAAAHANLDLNINQIKKWAKSLKSDSPEKRATKRCIPRITQTSYSFIDETSKVSTRQLLALTWAAMHDNKMRIGTEEDALKLFVTGLYEIQRGYNLNDKGVDVAPNRNDISICSGGTFNKIMEKMVGIHPDVNISFMNMSTATLKLPIVVKEEAQKYLTKLINDKHQNEPAALTDILENVKEDGVTVIWKKIKAQVGKQIFDEFKALFADKNDPMFIEFVEAGIFTGINDINLPQPYSLKDEPVKPLLQSPAATQHTSGSLAVDNSTLSGTTTNTSPPANSTPLAPANVYSLNRP